MKNKQEKYRKTLLEGFGREVLADLLQLCHFGETLDPDNKAQVAEYNVGISVLANLGVFSANTLDVVIEALGNIIPEKEEEDEKDYGSLDRGI